MSRREMVAIWLVGILWPACSFFFNVGSLGFLLVWMKRIDGQVLLKLSDSPKSLKSQPNVKSCNQNHTLFTIRIINDLFPNRSLHPLLFLFRSHRALSLRLLLERRLANTLHVLDY